MKFRLLLLLTVCLFFITSCNESKEQQLMRTLKEWEQKEILFPLDIKLSTVKDGETKFTFPVSNYKVLIYVDSIGGISCKLKMDKWLEFMSQINSVSSDTVPFLFFFHPRSEQEIRALLKVHKIDFPFCIDMNDKMNKLNNFPDDLTLQTFLLDKNNRVKIVGNPIYNLKLKKLYLRTVAGREVKDEYNIKQTKISCSTKEINMGHFYYQQQQQRELVIRNIGQVPLVINDIITSCGCTTVDYPKEPILPGKDAILCVNYQAEQPEHFNKTISIYCNVASSPVIVRLKGNAEK